MWSWTFWQKKFQKGLMYAGGVFLFLIVTGFFQMFTTGERRTVIVHEYARVPEPEVRPIRRSEREPLEWLSRGGEGEGVSAINRLLPNLKEVEVPPMHFGTSEDFAPVSAPPMHLGEDQGLAPVHVPPMRFGAPENRGPRFVWRNGRCVKLW